MTDVLDRLKTALSNRYAIERELGSGGMATVYLAEDLKHHRQVAIKVLRPELAATLGPERFVREIEIAANLTHPHILPLFDSGEDDGFLYYVMPFIKGESLRQQLDREGKLDVKETVRLTDQIASALSHAHELGLVHRDIKPENILLAGDQAIVADFGIARAVEVAGGERLTGTGLAVGTPAYMSPEQAVGDKNIDVRSDVYALGCVVYEMASGRAPFEDDTPQALLAKHAVDTAPSLRTSDPNIPPFLERAVDRALAKSPADRFQSASAFAEALTSEMVVARVGKAHWPRRVVAIAAVAALAILLIVAALLVPRGSADALDPNRVLVVAFADETGIEETRALGRMAQAYVIQTLADAGFANVVDPITTLAVARNVAADGGEAGPGSILALADDAQAGTVVAGSYYAAGDSVQIQVRITDASDGSVLGTVGPVVGSVGARGEIVARLGREVVGALASLLDQDIRSWEPSVQPATYEAYEAYSEGLAAYLWEEGHAAAARHFERAVAVDSTFFRAALWAAQSNVLVGPSHYARAESLLAPLVAARAQLSRYERCRLDFVVALGIRPSMSAGYEAARCMAQAAPGSDDAKRELAGFTWRLNRPAEAIELLRELDPDRGLAKQWSNYWAWIGSFRHMLGEYDAELAAAREGRQRFPESLDYPSIEARAWAALGRLDDVAAHVDSLRALHSSETLGYRLGPVALFLRVHGHRDAARELFDETIAWFRSRPLNTESVRATLAHWLYQAERWEAAQRLYQELARERSASIEYFARLGKLAARLGDSETASTVSEQLRQLERPHHEGQIALHRAAIAALLGDRQQAMTLLQEARELTPLWGVHALVHRDVDFESLHDYPPFQEFLRPKG